MDGSFSYMQGLGEKLVAKGFTPESLSWMPSQADIDYRQGMQAQREYQIGMDLQCNGHLIESTHGCINCPTTWKKPRLFRVEHSVID